MQNEAPSLLLAVIPGPRSGTRNPDRRRWSSVQHLDAHDPATLALWIPGSAARSRNDETWIDFPPNPLISLNTPKNFAPIHQHPFALRDNPAIALAGTRVMNRMSVEGTAPVRHAEVACWVMNPQDRAPAETSGNGRVLPRGKNAGGARETGPRIII